MKQFKPLRNSQNITIKSKSTPNCDDPINALKIMFVDMNGSDCIAAGIYSAKRPIFQRLHGVVYGTSIVNPKILEDLQIDIFAHNSFPVWIRFSNDVPNGIPDYKNTVENGIKLFNSPNKKLLNSDIYSNTQDFILQNHDIFFVDSVKEMYEFTYAGVIEGDYNKYLKNHPKTAKILKDMEKAVNSVIGIEYWSIPPSKLENQYIKYKIEPEVIPSLDLTPPDIIDPFYLSNDLQKRLLIGEARLRFMVQFRTNFDSMPLDEDTIRWERSFIHMVTLIINKQEIREQGQSKYGENLSYNIWHTLPQHEPVGSIAEDRKVVYEASANLRRNVNGIPIGEPTEPRLPANNISVIKDKKITYIAIHPAIGIARVGNSTDDYFIGPETIYQHPMEIGSYWDKNGALKRQAVRFRLFGYNASGEVVKEINSNDARIVWKVHIANKKAAWYRFLMAMDIPEAATIKAKLRNNDVKIEERNNLILDPGTKTISGRKIFGDEYKFTVSKFGSNNISIYLGELQTDDLGRLIFLGGHGISDSPSGRPIYDPNDPDSFANADGWYDDISDGPVSAEVIIEGEQIRVEDAWVVTAPPNYGGTIVGIRTMFDLLYDMYVRSGWYPFPQRISFTQHIYPILQRLKNLQWANKAFAIQFGHNSPNDFEKPEYLAKLSDSSDTYAEMRRQVLNSFRNPDYKDTTPLQWPWVYGDAMDIPATGSPREYLAISPTQFQFLRLWTEGQFDSDWKGETGNKEYRSLDEMPLSERPSMLDQAPLHFCAADAFHPGIEFTWPMRHTTIYYAPFRIRKRIEGQSEPFYGNILTQENVMNPGGPLYYQGPGDLTKWMAIPWQMDAASCRSGYEAEYDPYIPTFWPARVPNQVLSLEDYNKVIDSNKPRDQRVAAFWTRLQWTRNLTGLAVEQMKQMVKDYSKMGILEERIGILNDPDLPSTMMVESLPPAEHIIKETIEDREIKGEQASKLSQKRFDSINERTNQLLQKAGWESEEVRNSFHRAIRGISKRK